MSTRTDAKAFARTLVVHEHMTYADASVASGIPVDTLKKWGAAEGWQKERDSSMSYANNVRAIKLALMQRVQSGLADPETDNAALTQLVFAWQKAEQAFPEHRYTQQKEDPQLKIQVALEVLEEVYAYFRETDTNVLAKFQGHTVALAKRMETKFGALA